MSIYVYLCLSMSILLSFFLSFLSFFLSFCIYLFLSFLLKHLKHLKHVNRSNSARLPQKINAHSFKTQQVCDTSSKSESSQLQNHENLRDFLQFGNWQRRIRSNSVRPRFWRVQTWQPRANAFGDFSIPCPESIAPPKSEAMSYEVLHLSRKIMLPKPRIWCSKMEPLSGNQRPDLITCLTHVSLVLRVPREMHLCRSSLNVPRLPSFFLLQKSHFGNAQNLLRLPRTMPIRRPKVVRKWCVLTTKHNFPNWLTGLLSGLSSLWFLDMQTWICTVYIRIHARLETKSSSTLHTYV